MTAPTTTDEQDDLVRHLTDGIVEVLTQADGVIERTRAQIADAQDRLEVFETKVGDIRRSVGEAPAPTPPPADRKPTTKAAKKGVRPPAPTRPAKAAGDFTCVCGKVCANGTGLAAHQRHCKKAKAAAERERSGASSDGDSPALIDCPDCGESFENGAALATHRRKEDHWGEGE